MKKLFAAGAMGAALAATALAAPVMAQTYTLNGTFSAPGGDTGTIVLVLDNATLAPLTSVGNVALSSDDGTAEVPVELVSAMLTLNNLGAVPATTTFTRSDLTGLYFRRNATGAVSSLTFDAANSDGYVLKGIGPVKIELSKAGYSKYLTSTVPDGAAPIPTLSEWAMILLGVMLAGGAALTIQRRRAA